MDKKKFDMKEIGLPKLIIVFIAGILLILLSFGDWFSPSAKKTATVNQVNQSNTPTTVSQSSSNSNEAYTNQLEQKLEKLLQQAYGVGKVDVMITLGTSEQKVTLKDKPNDKESTSQTDSQGTKNETTTEKSEEKTVMVEGKDGSSSPYILQVVNPQIEGILVVAEGGDNITIKTQIINAAEVLFGVPIHKIEVMKMQ